MAASKLDATPTLPDGGFVTEVTEAAGLVGGEMMAPIAVRWDDPAGCSSHVGVNGADLSAAEPRPPLDTSPVPGVDVRGGFRYVTPSSSPLLVFSDAVTLRWSALEDVSLKCGCS